MDIDIQIRLFNSLPEVTVLSLLKQCCFCDEYCRRIAIRRPFCSYSALRDACDDEWWRLSPNHWRESFNGHPRIGDKKAVQEKAASNPSSWEGDEQKGTKDASNDILDAIRIGNIEYEKKFGFIFLICATNKDAISMLNALNSRLSNNNLIDEVIYAIYIEC